MNKEFIQQILEDIYMIDPDLKKQEKELIKIINEFEIAKPDTKFDEKFVQELKKEILNRIKILEEEKESRPLLLNFNYMKKIYYAAGGTLICALLVILIMSYLNKTGGSEATDLKLSLAPEIKRLDNHAFGFLGTDEMTNLKEAAQSFAAPLAATTEDEAGDEIAVAPGIGGGGGGAIATTPVTSKMIAPGYDVMRYNYIYKGDDLNLSEDKLLVYKKVINNEVGKTLAQAFNFDLGLIDLRKFKDLKISNLSLLEDREYGYMLYYNLEENVVSISTNWQQWPRPDADCRDEACFQSYRLTPNDIPGDTTLVTIADNFLKDYNLDTTNYGAGEVMDQWRRVYEMETNKKYAYVPETVQVVYPLLIDGKETYDDFGNAEGLIVDVDVRNRKAVGARGMSLQDYEASLYEVEKDASRILGIAEKGGLVYSYQAPNATKEIDIELGTPTLELMRYWQYNQQTGKGDSYYIPAYVFPIISESEKSYLSRKNIIVPIIKEFIDKREAEITPGIPEPMPLLRTEEAVAPNMESGIIEEQGVNNTEVNE